MYDHHTEGSQYKNQVVGLLYSKGSEWNVEKAEAEEWIYFRVICTFVLVTYQLVDCESCNVFSLFCNAFNVYFRNASDIF